MWWRAWLEQLVGNLLGWERKYDDEPLSCTGKPNCASTATLGDQKKEGDFFPGTKEGLSFSGSGPVWRMEEFTNVDGTVQVWPRAPWKWYLLSTHHSPENWWPAETNPSPNGTKETVTLLHPTPDITATDPEWPMPTSSVWVQHGPELASTLLQGSVGSPVTL